MASGTFKGFSPEAIAFLSDLKQNNNREWFTPRLDTFKELLRDPMLELVSAVHGAMLSFAPSYVGEPAKCMYRIYRDTRFSKDKTPYKTSVSALFWRNSLDKNAGAGYFISISPDAVGIGGGLYMAAPPLLLAVRQQIAADPEAFRVTFETKTVKRLMGELQGERAARVPKGFRADDPAAELLKMKQFLLYNKLDAGLATSPKLVKEVVSRFEAMTPLVEFLDRPLVGRGRLNPGKSNI